jgi:hypothetical protein
VKVDARTCFGSEKGKRGKGKVEVAALALAASTASDFQIRLDNMTRTRNSRCLPQAFTCTFRVINASSPPSPSFSCITSLADRITAHLTSSDDDAAFDISHIAGNASDDIKQLLGNPSAFLTNRPSSHHGPIFAEDIQRRLKVTEISIQRKAEEERKLEARYVVEVEVVQGM